MLQWFANDWSQTAQECGNHTCTFCTVYYLISLAYRSTSLTVVTYKICFLLRAPKICTFMKGRHLTEQPHFCRHCCFILDM
jgi:hypothetical protein